MVNKSSTRAPRIQNRKIIVSSVNGVGENGYPPAKE